MKKIVIQKKFPVILIIILVLVGLIIFMFHKQIFQNIGDYLNVEDHLYPADVIHVIAGDDYRTDYAIQLYKQGYAKYIFFTGGLCKYHGWYHGIHGEQLALENGVPAVAIAFDDSTVLSTFDETLLLKKWIEQNPNPISSVIVVSDPFHMRRARWTNTFVLEKNINIEMAPVPFDQTPFSEQWWTNQASRTYVRDEYVKMIYYFFRYQLSITWLASFDIN